jgi:hypothetical protein
MSGAIPLLPQHAYMVWCSVKAKGQIYYDLLPALRILQIPFMIVVERCDPFPKPTVGIY